MAELLPLLMVAAVLVAVMGGLAWLGRRVRRRGVGVAVMNTIDEIFHPAAHRIRHEIQVREERMAPRPAPDDQWRRRRSDVPRADGHEQ